MATAARTRTKLITKRSSKYVAEALYKRLFKDGARPQAVRKQLDEFLDSRKRAFKWEVGVAVRKLRTHERFKPALKLSEVMEKRGMNLTVSDKAIQLDLVAKSRGIASAEEYFVGLPESAKNHLTYGALLNCYCKELMTEKAEALMVKMRELNFASSPMAYNSLMTLYTKTSQLEKIPRIIQVMKANDVMPDCFTFNVWMRALAAVKDVSGVERIIEEMKRDGRVSPDWTTYSNLASIYADAGMFQKAEAALKELERRNTSHDLGAYQFLITLYGKTGNLVEVYRIWRSLKLAHTRMANMSYLNMIQVLINLKDLPGAEACFKEWELNRSNAYDIRVANAIIKGYMKEGMLEKAEAVKKRAKMNGGRLNAKTWEIFMDYYLEIGDMKMAHWCLDRAIKKGRSHGRIWVPSHEVVLKLMQYFEKNKDVAGAEKFIAVMQIVKKDLGQEVFESLVRTYAVAGKKCPGIRQRLKMENVVVSDEIDKLVDSVSLE